MHTLDRIIRKALWIFAPAAFAIVCAFAANSALQSDGIYVGHPKATVIYLNAKQDPRLTQLAAAIDVRQLRRK